MEVMEVHGLTKHYGSARKRFTAVDDVSFDVSAGQVFGFLGPNGSGKTTTIGMLLGIVAPSAGSFRLLGEGTPEGLRRARRRIGATLETPNFYPYLSGRDNLRVVANVKRAGVGDVDRVLDVVGLSARQRDRFSDYSLGMKQRLSLAATLIGDPELIILDEPANGLDPEGMMEMRDIIRGLASLGKTIFLSSHLLSEVERTCSHIAIIRRGHILCTSSVEALSGARIEVSLRAADLELLRAAAREYEHARGSRLCGDEVLVELRNDDLASLNRHLTGQGIHVTHLVRRQASLEDVFMSVTRESVADTTGVAA